VIAEGGMSDRRHLRAVSQHLPSGATSQGTKLSGGEQQMLAIARILRTGATLLLLDEPTEGLAPVIVQQIGAVIRKLKERGFTVLLVEQNFRFASPSPTATTWSSTAGSIDMLTACDVAANLERIQNYLKV
jgi:branched-chain amino acid transport system ATP-binding protein